MKQSYSYIKTEPKSTQKKVIQWWLSHVILTRNVFYLQQLN